MISKIIFVWACLLIPILLFSQNIKTEPIVLHNADSLVGITDESGVIRTYYGNVRLQQGNVRLFCDIARHYIDLKKVVLKGNVLIIQDDMTLTSAEINYNGNIGLADSDKGVVIKDNRSTLIAPKGLYSFRTKDAEFFEDVTIEDDSVTIYADRVKYNRQTRNSFAYGNVYVIGKYTNVILTAENIEYYPLQNLTVAYGNTILFDIDSTLKERTVFRGSNDENDKIVFKDSLEVLYDTLTIACDTMESIRGDGIEVYYFKKNVEINKGNTYAKAYFALYDKMGDSIVLNQNPIIWYEDTQLFSDSTVIYLENRKLKMISALGNAFAGTLGDTIYEKRINQLLGNKIELVFYADSLRMIISYGEAKSLYFLSGEQGPEGVSRSSADTIIIDVIENKPKFIRWVKAIDGEYYPEHLVSNNPEQYYLPSFRRENNKPTKRILMQRKSFY